MAVALADPSARARHCWSSYWEGWPVRALLLAESVGSALKVTWEYFCFDYGMWPFACRQNS